MNASVTTTQGNRSQYLFGSQDFEAMAKEYLSADRFKKLQDFFQWASPKALTGLATIAKVLLVIAAAIWNAVVSLLRKITGHKPKEKTIDLSGGEAKPGGSVKSVSVNIDAPDAAAVARLAGPPTLARLSGPSLVTGASERLRDLIGSPEKAASRAQQAFLLTCSEKMLDPETHENMVKRIENGDSDGVGREIAQLAGLDLAEQVEIIQAELVDRVREILGGPADDEAQRALARAIVVALPADICKELMVSDDVAEKVREFLADNSEPVMQFLAMRSALGGVESSLHENLDPMHDASKVGDVNGEDADPRSGLDFPGRSNRKPGPGNGRDSENGGRPRG